MNHKKELDVAVVRIADAVYPRVAPFHPSYRYPEYPFGDCISTEPNNAYDGVRELLRELEFDAEHLNTPAWNPLGHIIAPGMTVVIKPNFVVSRHRERKDLFSIISHASVLRAVADYAWIALKGSGRLIIADAPQYDCNFRELLEATGLDQVVSFFKAQSGPEFDCFDLRLYWSRGKHFFSLWEFLPGDPQGNLTINLGKKSALYQKENPEKLYGAVYDRQETIAHHSGDRQEYQVSSTIMNANVVISVPKLKVHKKVGVTLNVKGLVGINTNKNYLVHYSITPPRKGGDQYPNALFTPTEEKLIRLERWMYDHLLAPRNRALEYIHRTVYWIHHHTLHRLGLKVSEQKRLLDAGNWYGNDSAWRMAVDLYKLFTFADSFGRLHDTPQRRTFSVIDGIVGGDVNGPLLPDPVPAGTLLAGENLLAVDLVGARLMGFDVKKLRMYQSLLGDDAFDFGVRRLEDVRVLCRDATWARCLSDHESAFLGFRPHPGWVGHIEISGSVTAAFAEEGVRQHE